MAPRQYQASRTGQYRDHEVAEVTHREAVVAADRDGAGNTRQQGIVRGGWLCREHIAMQRAGCRCDRRPEGLGDRKTTMSHAEHRAILGEQLPGDGGGLVEHAGLCAAGQDHRLTRAIRCAAACHLAQQIGERAAQVADRHQRQGRGQPGRRRRRRGRRVRLVDAAQQGLGLHQRLLLLVLGHRGMQDRGAYAHIGDAVG